MKATDFVKKYGWFGANEYLAGATFINDNLLIFTNAEELQSLVNAYEFVSAHSGVKAAKKYCDLHDPYETSNHYNNLRAKIKLVESVNE